MEEMALRQQQLEQQRLREEAEKERIERSRKAAEDRMLLREKALAEEEARER